MLASVAVKAIKKKKKWKCQWLNKPENCIVLKSLCPPLLLANRHFSSFEQSAEQTGMCDWDFQFGVLTKSHHKNKSQSWDSHQIHKFFFLRLFDATMIIDIPDRYHHHNGSRPRPRNLNTHNVQRRDGWRFIVKGSIRILPIRIVTIAIKPPDIGVTS